MKKSNDVNLGEYYEMASKYGKILMELYEIKFHLCNQRHFEGGVALGGLINSLISLRDQEISKKHADHNDNQDEDRDEDEEDSYNYKEVYEEKCEEIMHLKTCLSINKEVNKDLETELNDLNTLIKQLLSNDHVYPESREIIEKKLLESEELIINSEGRIVKKPYVRSL